MKTSIDFFRRNPWIPLPNVMDQLMQDYNGTEKFVPLDVSECNDHYIVKADIPGLKSGDFKVETKEGVLQISGERKFETKENKEAHLFQERVYGKFQRVVKLPLDANLEKIEALYKDGVLTVAIPKTAEKKSQEVNVKTEDQEGFFTKLLN